MGERRKKGKVGKTSKVERAFSAGGVVFKKDAKEFKFLIINPTGTRRWQLPKGLIDDGESSKETAIREIAEEGGVDTEVIVKLGDARYFFVWEGKKIFKTVTFYLMRYTKDTGKGHDKEVDEAVFLPFEKAYGRLTFKDDKKFLQQAKDKIERGLQETLI